MVHDAELILVAGALLAAAVAASLVAARVRLPALILFLGLGMAIGTDGLGWIDFADYGLARLIGTVALVLILFEGGLSAGWGEIRPVLGPSLLLAILGTLATAAIAAAGAHLLFGLSWLEALLLGAILAPTDGAAVFALVRDTALPPRLARTLEGEAGFNDPVAVLLVLIAIELILNPAYGAGDVVAFVAREIAIGTVVGVAVGVLATHVSRRTDAAPAGTALVVSLSAAAIAYGAAAALEGSGFLAVYLAGLTLSGARYRERAAVATFHGGLASVAEIGLFLSLGLLVFPSQLGDVAVKGLVLALVTAVIARPAATLLATVRQRFTMPERLLLGWSGLRGAVPVILATLPVIRHVPGSITFFNIVFFAVLLSAVVQGSTIRPLASRVGARVPG